MKYPDKLKKGDTVGIVAVSSDTETSRVKECIRKVEELGFKVKAADNLDTNYCGYMAGHEKVRAE